MSSNLKIEKICQWCGKSFIARTTTTAYCSHRCSGLAYKERKRKKKVEECRSEIQRVQSGQAQIQEMDFLTPRKAAQLVGICYKTFYNYINNGTIKAWKLKRKTLVRRADVESLFSALPERMTVEKEKKAITEFYTTQEVMDKTGYQMAGSGRWQKSRTFQRLCIVAKISGAKVTLTGSLARKIRLMTLKSGILLARFKKSSA